VRADRRMCILCFLSDVATAGDVLSSDNLSHVLFLKRNLQSRVCAIGIGLGFLRTRTIGPKLEDGLGLVRDLMQAGPARLVQEAHRTRWKSLLEKNHPLGSGAQMSMQRMPAMRSELRSHAGPPPHRTAWGATPLASRGTPHKP
jgi:hypothetical protein